MLLGEDRIDSEQRFWVLVLVYAVTSEIGEKLFKLLKNYSKLWELNPYLAIATQMN